MHRCNRTGTNRATRPELNHHPEALLPEASVVVARLSSSFQDLWRQLGETTKVEMRLADAHDLRSVPRCAALVLACGGAERDALDWLDARERGSGLPVYVVGSDPGRRIAAQAVGRGATDYFAIPEDTELLRNALTDAVTRFRPDPARPEPRKPDDDLTAFREIVGESPALKVVLHRAARLLQHAQGTILITGEAGTGKETLARAIHHGGARAQGPFVPVNCPAVPRDLLESDLLGCEPGVTPEAH